MHVHCAGKFIIALMQAYLAGRGKDTSPAYKEMLTNAKGD